MENNDSVIVTAPTASDRSTPPQLAAGSAVSCSIPDAEPCFDWSKHDAILFRVASLTPAQIIARRRASLVAERYTQIRTERLD